MMIDIEKLRGHLGNLWAQTSMSDIGSKSKLDEALTELERLRKKEMPMKPNEIELVDLEPSVGVCDCGKEVYSFENYCSSCGQKLDWSDEK